MDSNNIGLSSSASLLKDFGLRQVPLQTSPVTNPQIYNNISSAQAEVTSDTKHNKSKEVAKLAMTALGAACFGGVVVAFSKGRKINALNAEKSELQKGAKVLEEKLSSINNSFSLLSPEELEKFTAKQEERLKILEEKVSKLLDFDPMTPPVKTKVAENSYERRKIFKYDENFRPLSTTIRGDRPNFEAPTLSQLKRQGSVDMQIPIHSKQKPSVDPKAKIGSNSILGENATSYSSELGNSTNWTPQKISRDVLQNFYDGQGHSLEGIKYDIKFNPTTKKYNIKISGNGEYNHEAMELVGTDSKRAAQDPYDAGGFGEGGKVVALEMLKNYDVPKVTFSSADWQLSYKIGDSAGKNKQRAFTTLEKVDYKPKYSSMEFVTTNEDLVSSILESPNFFYHPENPHYKTPSFENEHFGFKVLMPQGRGSIYYVNQRFEYGEDGKWENGLQGLNVFFKRKIAEINKGRDRLPITPDELSTLSKEFANTMTDKELMDSVYSLKDYWSSLNLKDDVGGKEAFNKLAAVNFMRGLIKEASLRGLKFEIPESQKLLALKNYPYVSDEIVLDYMHQGYTICDEEFANLGIESVHDHFKKYQVFKPVEPDSTQIKKINILDEATREVVDSMKTFTNAPKISLDDAKRPTYLFNASNSKDNDNTLAQAIISPSEYDRDTHQYVSHYQGHWLDNKYLNKGSFSSILGTRLHEMTHQYGGDESSNFSYALTDVLKDFIASVDNDPALRLKLHDLETLWNRTK